MSGQGRRFQVVVCLGPTCGSRRGGAALVPGLLERIDSRGLSGRVRVVRETCLGHCLRGANVLVCDADLVDQGGGGIPWGGGPGVVLYNRVELKDLDRIVDRHLAEGVVVTSLLNRPPFGGA